VVVVVVDGFKNVFLLVAAVTFGFLVVVVVASAMLINRELKKNISSNFQERSKIISSQMEKLY
jgi:hypothetical protein